MIDKENNPFGKSYENYLKEVNSLQDAFTDSEKHRIKENVSKLNEKFLEGELTVPDHIYIDLPLLRDIHLGTLFAMIQHRPTAQEDYLYIKEALKDYQLRFYDDPLRYVPKLNITQDEYKAYREDVRHHNDIFMLAPFTIFQFALKHNLKQNAQHSQMIKKYKDIPIPKSRRGEFVRDFEDITFYVNMWPLKIYSHYLKNFQALLSDNLGVNVVLLNHDPKTISSEFLQKMDEINTYRLDQLMLNEPVKKAFSDEKFIGKMLFAPLLTDPANEEKFISDDELRRDKQFIGNVFQLFCNFKYIEAARYAVTLEVYGDPQEVIRYKDIAEDKLPDFTMQ